MQAKLFNVAIDGPSAAGKGTISKQIAKQFSLISIDTGAMYRAVALNIIRHQVNFDNNQDILRVLSETSISFNKFGHVLLNGEDVSSLIRSQEISDATSRLSENTLIRTELVKQQQEIAKNKGFILEGRDIGSVVLPDAEVKIFLTASEESRAKRRHLEYIEKGLDTSFAEVLQEINERDLRDSTRDHSPLILANDAIIVDTSNLNIEESVAKITEIIYKKLGELS